MGNISVSLPSDGQTIDAADYNTPITTIVNEINGNLDNSNIASGAAIATSKLASDGGITDPKLANYRSAVRVYRGTSTQSIGNNSYTKVQWNAETYDNLGEFDSSTNYRFTATYAGTYVVNAAFVYQSALGSTNDGRIAIYKNGSRVAEAIYENLGNFNTLQISDIVKLAANDYLEIYAFQLSGGSININPDETTAYFTVARL